MGWKLLRLSLAILLPLMALPALLTTVLAVRVCTEPLDVTSARQRLERDLRRLQSAPAPGPPDQPLRGAGHAAPVQSGEPDAPEQTSRPRYLASAVLPFSIPHGDTLEEFVDDVLASDVARYWFHALLGRSLEVARCNPSASGLQWLKAAAHAHTPRQVQRAASGVARDLGRSRDPAQTRTVLCAALGASLSAPQAVVTAASGLSCPRS
jgi:hypothetical protein